MTRRNRPLPAASPDAFQHRSAAAPVCRSTRGSIRSSDAVSPPCCPLCPARSPQAPAHPHGLISDIIVIVVILGLFIWAALQMLSPSLLEAQPLLLESVLEPAISAQVHARQSGAVAEVRVAVGDPVQADDTLACLDSRSWQLQAEIAGLDLVQARSRLRRVKPLYAQGGLSVQDLEQLEHQVRSAELRQQEADLALTAAVLTSPLAGVVAAVTVEPGQHVVAGQPCLLVIDARDLQAQFYIPVDDYRQVRRGQAVIAEYQPDPADDPALRQPAVADQVPTDLAGPSPSSRAAAGVPAGPSSSPQSSTRSALLPLRGCLVRLAPTVEPGTDQCLAVARIPEAGRHYPPGTHVRITLSQE